MDRIAVAVTWLRELVGSVAPYVFLEVVMPGGTLLALLLYLHRRRVRARDTAFGAPPSELRDVRLQVVDPDEDPVQPSRLLPAAIGHVARARRSRTAEDERQVTA